MGSSTPLVGMLCGAVVPTGASSARLCVTPSLITRTPKQPGAKISVGAQPPPPREWPCLLNPAGR